MKLKGKIIAIDHGTSRAGIAISDPFQEIAFPRVTFLNDDFFLDNLVTLIEEESAVAILVGKPYQLNHSINRQTKIVDDFVSELKERTSVPIIMRDEKLTTFDARELVDNSLDKRQIAADKDQLAAMIILQEYLAEIS